MAEPTYNFSGLQKKASTPPSAFNFTGLKQKAIIDPNVASPQERGFFPADASLLSKAPPQDDLLGALASPFKNFAAGAKELFVDKGDEPLVPLSKIVSRPEKPLTGGYGTLAGIGRGVAGFAESFTTPKNLAIAVATGGIGAIPIIGKVGLPAIEAFFAYEAAHQVPELWREYQKAPLADKPELMTKIIGSIGIAGLAGAGAAKKTAGLGRELKSLTDVAPEVAPERAIPLGQRELSQAGEITKEISQNAEIAKPVRELAAAKAKAQQALNPTPKQDIGTLAKDLEGVVGPQLTEADLGTPPVKPKSETVTTRQALQEDWQSKQVQDGDFLRDPTTKDVFEKTTGLAFTDNFQKEFAAWRKAKGSEFELGDAEVFANEKRAKLPRDRALVPVEKPKEIKIVDLAPPTEKTVDTLAERRRVVAEKRQALAEERLKLQEQRLEAQKQRAIEQLSKKYKVTGLNKKSTPTPGEKVQTFGTFENVAREPLTAAPEKLAPAQSLYYVPETVDRIGGFDWNEYVKELAEKNKVSFALANEQAKKTRQSLTSLNLRPSEPAIQSFKPEVSSAPSSKTPAFEEAKALEQLAQDQLQQKVITHFDKKDFITTDDIIALTGHSYGKAARLLESMEKDGVLSKPDPVSGVRKLVTERKRLFERTHQQVVSNLNARESFDSRRRQIAEGFAREIEKQPRGAFDAEDVLPYLNFSESPTVDLPNKIVFFRGLRSTGKPTGMSEFGRWFSSAKDVARTYGENVIEVTLDAKKLFNYKSATEKSLNEIAAKINDRDYRFNQNVSPGKTLNRWVKNFGYKKIKQTLQDLGYDGLYNSQGQNLTGWGKTAPEVAVFSDTQISEITGRGRERFAERETSKQSKVLKTDRPSEQYAQGQKTVEGLIAKYKEQAIPKSEWSGLAKDELAKQGYSSRIVSELTEPKRTALKQAPGYETSRAGRAERAVEPTPELKPKVDELANAAKPNQIAQADYERGRQEILAELEKDPNLKVYFDSGEGFYKVEVLQKEKLTPEALQAVQELRKQAALEGGYSLETVGRGHEIAVTPEGYYEGKSLAGTTLAEKIGDLVNRKKAVDAAHEAFVKAKNKAEPDLVDRYLTEEGAAPLLGKTTSGEGVEIVTRRNRSAVEPDAPEWVKQIEQAKRTGEKQLGDPYVSIYRVTEKTAKKAEGEGFTFLRKNLSEADNAKLDAVVANMTKAANELSANPAFNIKIGLEAYKNLAEFGYLTLKASGKALLTKAEWASRMLTELGESVRPFLDDIWKSIQGGWKPGAELEMPKAFAEREPRAVEAKATLEKEPPPLSGWDKFNIIAMANKLASVSSLVRSSAGNLTMQLLKTPKRALSPQINKFLAQISGAPRDRFAEEAAVEFYGTLRSLRQGVEEAQAVIKENHDALKNSLFIEQESGRLVKSAEQSGIAKPFWYYGQMPIKLQGAVDALVRVPSSYGLMDMMAVRQALKEGKTGPDYVARVEQLQSEIRSGNTELGKKLFAEVKDEAAEMTFQKQLGDFGQKVNNLRQYPLLKFIVPFMNTSVNLWKQSVRHTPLNLLTPTFIRHIKTAFKKNPELRSIGGLSDDIAAMTTGTAFMLATYGAWKGLLGGDVIGYGPEDQRERQRLLATGWKPYSLKIGDTYVSFKGFEPLSTWLTLMADTMEGRAKGNLAGSLDAITQNVLRNFSENPFMTGIVETNDALLGKTDLPEFVAGMALGATMPTFLQQTARVVDLKYRQTPQDANDLEKLAAEYLKRVPFLSKTLPAALDVFGRERTVDSPALRYLAVNISKQDRGVVQDELRRLDVGIGFPRDTYKGLELTEPQMRELLVLAGGRMEKALAKLVVSPGYKQLRDEEKKSAINYVVNKVREDSKEFLFKHLATKKVQPKNRGSAVAKPFAR